VEKGESVWKNKKSKREGSSDGSGKEKGIRWSPE